MIGHLHDMMFDRNGDCLLTVSTREQCGELFDELKDCEVEVTIKKARKKRSLDANAYAWVLMDKLAAVLGYKKEDIYRYAIRNIGGNSDTVCVQNRAVERLRESWSRNGIGWVSEIMPSKIDDCTNVILYYGSSTFDSYQMSRFIDLLVQDCKSCGIETMPPDKLEALLNEWAA